MRWLRAPPATALPAPTRATRRAPSSPTTSASRWPTAHALHIGGHPVVSDTVLFEKQQRFNRAKIVERAVHACGSGAFGYVEVTHDLCHLCRAAMFSSVGKRTPMFSRFSTVTYGKKFPDSARNPGGLAWKFYTEQGIYDILTVNFPSFFVRDPTMGPDTIRSQQRHLSSFKVASTPCLISCLYCQNHRSPTCGTGLITATGSAGATWTASRAHVPLGHPMSASRTSLGENHSTDTTCVCLSLDERTLTPWVGTSTMSALQARGQALT